MEADIELAALILSLMFAIVVLVRGLSAIASMIDVLKFARGPFSSWPTPLVGASAHGARPIRCSGAQCAIHGGEGQLG